MNLCQEWQAMWTKKSKDELMEMYITGIDFAIKNDWPSCEYLKKNFNRVIHRHGVYVDDRISIRNKRQVVCNGKTHGEAYYDGYSVGALYLRHDSDVTIYVKDFAYVTIEVYDRSKVTIINNGERTVHVFRYGGTVENEGGKVSIRDRRLPTE